MSAETFKGTTKGTKYNHYTVSEFDNNTGRSRVVARGKLAQPFRWDGYPGALVFAGGTIEMYPDPYTIEVTDFYAFRKRKNCEYDVCVQDRLKGRQRFLGALETSRTNRKTGTQTLTMKRW